MWLFVRIRYRIINTLDKLFICRARFHAIVVDTEYIRQRYKRAYALIGELAITISLLNRNHSFFFVMLNAIWVVRLR